MNHKPLSGPLQVAQLRVHSITAGLSPELTGEDSELLQFDDGRGVRMDVSLRLVRFNAKDLGGEPRHIYVNLRDLVALARIEVDSPLRADPGQVPDKVPRAKHDGRVLEPVDHPRLGDQLQAVYDLMRDGVWRTLTVIQKDLEARGQHVSATGISARLRDLRKPKFGMHAVHRESLGGGLYRYRLEPRRVPS